MFNLLLTKLMLQLLPPTMLIGILNVLYGRRIAFTVGLVFLFLGCCLVDGIGSRSPPLQSPTSSMDPGQQLPSPLTTTTQRISTSCFASTTLIISTSSAKRGGDRRPQRRSSHNHHRDMSSSSLSSSSQPQQEPSNNGQDNSNNNKAMAFLKKIGKVGGAANRDFGLALGFDEGESGKAVGGGTNTLQKSPAAFVSCTQTGIIDDMSESFPYTTCGTQWAGFTDRVIGGVSTGNLSREIFDGKSANVLRGHVSLANNGGFIQMATNLALPIVVQSSTATSSNAGGSGMKNDRLTVDASHYTGVELDVQSSIALEVESIDNEREAESFNVHLKNAACPKPYTSYRATFDAPNGRWATVRLPFSIFRGKGMEIENTPFDTSTLSRIGIVAIGRAMKVQLAVAGVRFY